MDKWEKGVVMLLNFDGWELEWIKGGARGKTPKGKDCIIAMQFLKEYSYTKAIEKARYNALKQATEEIKLYFVNDTKGNYIFWLNNITPQESADNYILTESQAAIINLN